ncbi:hypothetical protein SDC9_59246 [bioreactor metagenome]|uniref:Uncharacterized protein n=1 Tax=bioreactor metagenome TaxID=1076179 RepID=A0A644XAW6_9ZZZZ
MAYSREPYAIALPLPGACGTPASEHVPGRRAEVQPPGGLGIPLVALEHQLETLVLFPHLSQMIRRLLQLVDEMRLRHVEHAVVGQVAHQVGIDPVRAIVTTVFGVERTDLVEQLAPDVDGKKGRIVQLELAAVMEHRHLCHVAVMGRDVHVAIVRLAREGHMGAQGLGAGGQDLARYRHAGLRIAKAGALQRLHRAGLGDRVVVEQDDVRLGPRQRDADIDRIGEAVIAVERLEMDAPGRVLGAQVSAHLLGRIVVDHDNLEHPLPVAPVQRLDAVADVVKRLPVRDDDADRTDQIGGVELRQMRLLPRPEVLAQHLEMGDMGGVVGDRVLGAAVVVVAQQHRHRIDPPDLGRAQDQVPVDIAPQGLVETAEPVQKRPPVNDDVVVDVVLVLEKRPVQVAIAHRIGLCRLAAVEQHAGIDHVGVGQLEQCAHMRCKKAAVPGVVTVEIGNDLAMGLPQGGVARHGNPAVLAQLDQPNARIVKAAHHRHAVVAAAVVNDDQLEVRIGLRQHRCNRLADNARTVEHRHHHRDQRPGRRRQPLARHAVGDVLHHREGALVLFDKGGHHLGLGHRRLQEALKVPIVALRLRPAAVVPAELDPGRLVEQHHLVRLAIAQRPRNRDLKRVPAVVDAVLLEVGAEASGKEGHPLAFDLQIAATGQRISDQRQPAAHKSGAAAIDRAARHPGANQLFGKIDLAQQVGDHHPLARAVRRKAPVHDFHRLGGAHVAQHHRPVAQGGHHAEQTLDAVRHGAVVGIGDRPEFDRGERVADLAEGRAPDPETGAADEAPVAPQVVEIADQAGEHLSQRLGILPHVGGTMQVELPRPGQHQARIALESLEDLIDLPARTENAAQQGMAPAGRLLRALLAVHLADHVIARQADLRVQRDQRAHILPGIRHRHDPGPRQGRADPVKLRLAEAVGASHEAIEAGREVRGIVRQVGKHIEMEDMRDQSRLPLARPRLPSLAATAGQEVDQRRHSGRPLCPALLQIEGRLEKRRGIAPQQRPDLQVVLQRVEPGRRHIRIARAIPVGIEIAAVGNQVVEI